MWALHTAASYLGKSIQPSCLLWHKKSEATHLATGRKEQKGVTAGKETR